MQRNSSTAIKETSIWRYIWVTDGQFECFPKGKDLWAETKDKQELTREPDKGRVPYRGDMQREEQEPDLSDLFKGLQVAQCLWSLRCEMKEWEMTLQEARQWGMKPSQGVWVFLFRRHWSFLSRGIIWSYLFSQKMLLLVQSSGSQQLVILPSGGDICQHLKTFLVVTTGGIYQYLVDCMRASSVAQLCLTVTPWTAACQAPLSMGFSRQDYWSGLHFLLQGIFLTQGSKPRLLHLLH